MKLVRFEGMARFWKNTAYALSFCGTIYGSMVLFRSGGVSPKDYKSDEKLYGKVFLRYD